MIINQLKHRFKKNCRILSLNIPIICNEFNNDIKNLLSDKNIGFLYNFETNINIHKIYEEINKIYIKNKQYKYARKISEKIFSLKNAKNQYHTIYENLIE